jgi:hypothetical protein
MENAGGTSNGDVNTCNLPAFFDVTILLRFPARVIAPGVRLRFDGASLVVLSRVAVTASPEVKH